MIKKSIHAIFLISAAFVLGVLATVFSWVIYLMVNGQMPKDSEIFVAEQFIPADIEIDVSKRVGTVKGPWTAYAQGGEEAGGMLVGTVDKMKKLKPSYVRLDHIFDDDYYGVVRREGGTLRANFTKLDQTIDNITAMGAKPFLSLGYMPSEIASSKTDQPNNWDEWQWLVDQTIRHYSGKNAKNIKNVYYEVWNEPDLESFGYWKYYGEKSYMNLYGASARAAKPLKNDTNMQSFKFGGPGITALYKNWVLSLIKFADGNGYPLDFISWHRYDYYPSRFTQDIDEMKEWLGEDFGGYEMVISEWGPDPGKTPIYSGKYAAAHAVAVSRELIDGIDWAYAFEVKDGPGQEDFGWGLLTHNTVGMKPKPRYYGLSLLNNMSGNRLRMIGEGSNVVGWAVGSSNNVRVVLTNFQPNGSDLETVPVKFTGLASGQYRLRWEGLNGQSDQKIILVELGDESISQDIVVDENEIVFLNLELIKPVKKIPDIYNNIGGGSGFGKVILDSIQ